MSKFRIPYGRQSIDQDDIDAVVETLQSDFLTQGPKVNQFEKDFSAYVGTDFSVAVSNGTAGLHIGCLALGLNPGDRVITAPITFAASANSVLYCGGEVVFADIDRQTYTLDIEKVKNLIESKPKGYFKGVIPVAFGGNPVNTEEYKKLCEAHGLWLMLDACHAPGASFEDSNQDEVKIGSCQYADLTVFSFHPVKHIATGEGGMVTAQTKELYDRLLTLRTHGITKENMLMEFPNADKQGGWYYEMQDLGYNYRITDIQAALGVAQLKKASNGVKKRRAIATVYQDAFSEMNVLFQKQEQNGKNSYHLFVIEVDDRLGLYNYLRDNGVFAQIHYIPVHLMPYYQQKGWKSGDFPEAENYYEKCISLPMYPTLTDEEQAYVIEKVKEFIHG